MRILLIEDDELIADALAKALIDRHYSVDTASDGETGWELAESFSYDLILLDVVLPKLDGITLCQRLRASHNQTPVLLLTAQDTRSTRVVGLDAGADDYLAKPFDLQELLARVRALLRRSGAALPPLLEWRNLQLDPSTCEVMCNGQLLHLTPKEYGLLDLFLRNSHRIFSCGSLINHLWSLEEPPTEDTVRSHVKGLRQKLKAAGVSDDPLETVYGIGYRLKPAEQNKNEASEVDKKLPINKLDPLPLFQSKSAIAAQTTKTAPNVSQEVVSEAEKVWAQAKESFGRRIALVEQAVTLLLKDQLSQKQRQQAELEAHKLAGSLGMFGVNEGSRLAKTVEDLLADDRALNRQERKKLANIVSNLRQALERADDAVPELLLVSEPVDERPQLLIVHSDQAVTDQLIAEANLRGLRSHVVSDVTSARSLLAERLPDVVLLDLPTDQHKQDSSPPSPASLALLAELSSYSPPIPVIVLTTQNQLIDRVKIARLGGKRILQSPINPVEAVEAVNQVLQHTQQADARVLVVDDDPHVLISLQKLLQPWGIKVSILDTPLRFLEVLEMTDPDLLILDVEMPCINGIELCQVVRNDPLWSGIPILFLTAHTDAETMQQVFMAGADDFVRKPVVGPELVTRILNRLERSRLLQTLSEIDTLTEVANRRKSTEALMQLLESCKTNQRPFCFAILDLDQLKTINHQHSHAAGDQVLFHFGKLLQQTFHSEDVVGRWGGTEFVVGMAGMTKQEGEQRISEVLKNLREMIFTSASGISFHTTCSAGVADATQENLDLQILYQMADDALKQAKKQGGDRIICC